jgi:hypothetical protein
MIRSCVFHGQNVDDEKPSFKTESTQRGIHEDETQWLPKPMKVHYNVTFAAFLTHRVQTAMQAP